MKSSGKKRRGEEQRRGTEKKDKGDKREDDQERRTNEKNRRGVRHRVDFGARGRKQTDGSGRNSNQEIFCCIYNNLIM